MGTAEDTTSRPSQRNGVWVSRDLRDDRSDARSHVVHPQRGICRRGSCKVRRSPSRKRIHLPSPIRLPAENDMTAQTAIRPRLPPVHYVGPACLRLRQKIRDATKFVSPSVPAAAFRDSSLPLSLPRRPAAAHPCARMWQKRNRKGSNSPRVALLRAKTARSIL